MKHVVNVRIHFLFGDQLKLNERTSAFPFSRPRVIACIRIVRVIRTIPVDDLDILSLLQSTTRCGRMSGGICVADSVLVVDAFSIRFQVAIIRWESLDFFQPCVSRFLIHWTCEYVLECN
jgi:hypothetical protein